MGSTPNLSRLSSTCPTAGGAEAAERGEPPRVVRPGPGRSAGEEVVGMPDIIEKIAIGARGGPEETWHVRVADSVYPPELRISPFTPKPSLDVGPFGGHALFKRMFKADTRRRRARELAAAMAKKFGPARSVLDLEALEAPASIVSELNHWEDAVLKAEKEAEEAESEIGNVTLDDLKATVDSILPMLAVDMDRPDLKHIHEDMPEDYPNRAFHLAYKATLVEHKREAYQRSPAQYIFLGDYYGRVSLHVRFGKVIGRSMRDAATAFETSNDWEEGMRYDPWDDIIGPVVVAIMQKLSYRMMKSFYPITLDSATPLARATGAGMVRNLYVQRLYKLPLNVTKGLRRMLRREPDPEPQP